VYAVGGADQDARVSNTVWRFTGNSTAWEQVASLTTARASLAAASVPDGGIYAIGGSAGGAASGAAEVFDPVQDRWTPLPLLPTPRAWLAAATAPDGRVYTFGGQLIAFQSAPDGGLLATYNPSAAVEIYDPSANTWSTGPSMPTARWALAAVLGPDGAFYVMGGQTDLTHPTDVVERLLPDGGWQSLPSLSSARSGLAAAVGPDQRIYAISGYVYGGATVGTVDVFDPSAGTWSVAPLPLPTPRYGLAAATAPGPRGYVYAIGGGINGSVGAILDTVEVLITDFGQWQ
jgi:N-acetylneuraminic acid mutarotase